MDIKTLLKENSLQLFIVFTIFLFMIVFGCAWAASNVEQYMLRSAEEMLAAAEERVRAKLRESETALVSMGVTMIEKQINQQGNLDLDEVQHYLNSVNDTFNRAGIYAEGYQNAFWYKPAGDGGIYVSGYPWDVPGSLKFEEFPWYPLAAASPGRIVVTSPYQSPRSLSQIITIASLLQKEDGETCGFLGIDISIRDIAGSAAFYQTKAGGYGFLIGPLSETDSRLCFLVHPDSGYEHIPLEVMGPQYAALEQRLNRETEILSSIRMKTMENAEIITFYQKTFSGWYIGLAFPKKEYFRDVYVMSVIYSITSVGMMLILCYFLLRLSMDKMQSDEENRAKSSFLAQISHEIRTPLNSILGMSDIILRKDLSPDVYEDVSIIRQAGNILLSIINNILDFAKIEIKKISLESKPYNMASMLNDVINIVRLRLTDSHVNLFVDLDSSIPAELIGDEVKVRQLLINLINNAVKYTKQGYIKFTIRQEPVFPSSPSGGGNLRIVFSVEDTGIGIKQADMEHLFKEFTRLDIEHNRGIEGTGLGLSISNAFCKAMGGGISVKSVYGRGSTFTAEIIQTYKDPKPAAQVEDPDKRVLIYEDRPACLQSLLAAFNSLNMLPQCARDLSSFLDGIKTKNYDYAFIPARYAAVCVSCLEESASAVKLIVMLNADDMSSSFRTGNAHLPIHSASLANILNGMEAEKHTIWKDCIGFTAPDARILVVDDLPTNLRVAEELMKPYGMKIDACLSGSDALSLVKQNRYDIVFMDHMMPEMDGLMTTELIRKQGGPREEAYFRDLPIIMLTANAMAGQREMFLENGINDFLAKPINLGKLNSILLKWIPREKQHESAPAAAGDRPRQRGAGDPPLPFPAVPGIEIETGLQNAGGSPEAYKNILSYFRTDMEERIPQIQEAAEKEDWAFYTTAIHAIKGASRSIGAMELGADAAELETAGREKNAGLAAAKTGALLEKLRSLLGHIDSILGKPGAEQGNGRGPEDEGLSPQDAAGLGLEDLKEALNNMDTEKINAVLAEINAKAQSPGVKKIVSRIEQCVLLFEYEEAVMIIDQISTPRTHYGKIDQTKEMRKPPGRRL
jgi:signal transduction histidine kinase/CheY-like chemotaxis protein